MGPIELQRADLEGLRLFYSWMRRQFHPDEIKPMESILPLWRQGLYAAWGLRQGKTLLGYALAVRLEDRSAALLDYFAILPEWQGQGLGSRFLADLQRSFAGMPLLIEVEDPETVEGAEREHRLRRIRFYQRAGAQRTGVRLKLFGCDYEIMAQGLPAATAGSVRSSMERLYHSFLSEQRYRDNVHFREER